MPFNAALAEDRLHGAVDSLDMTIARAEAGPEKRICSPAAPVSPVNLIGTREAVRGNAGRHPSAVRGRSPEVMIGCARQIQQASGSPQAQSFSRWLQHAMKHLRVDEASVCGSGRAALIPMVQSTDFGMRLHVPFRGAEPAEVPARPCRATDAYGSMVMFDEHPEPAAQIPLTKYDYVVEAFTPNRANDPFDVCPLPWRTWSRQYLLNADSS